MQVKKNLVLELDMALWQLTASLNLVMIKGLFLDEAAELSIGDNGAINKYNPTLPLPSVGDYRRCQHLSGTKDEFMKMRWISL
jgi:hypothetical protein